MLRLRWPLFYLRMVPRHKSRDAGHSGMPKRRCKGLRLSEKVKILSLIRKEKKIASEVAKTSSKNRSSLCEIVKKENEIHAGLVAPPTAKITVTVHDKCLVSMEKAWNLSKMFWERSCSRIIFITAYCYNCSTFSLAIIVPLLLCLIYKLIFITGIRV